MGAAIWSMSMADMLDFPLQFFVRFFKNHGLLSVNNRPQWRVIEGGSSAYIAPLTATFSEKIRLNCPVTRVERDEDGVVIHSAAGSERFDKVVFACHSDQALKLLAKPSEAEQSILGALPYADNEVVLHTDTRLLPDAQTRLGQLELSPRRRRPYTGRRHLRHEHPARHPERHHVLRQPQPERRHQPAQGARPTTPTPIRNTAWRRWPRRTRWEELDGAQHTFYCGAYWANGFHEDGVVSALRVARSFGEVL